MHAAYRSLAWGGVDFRFLGRFAWRVSGCEPCMAEDRISFAAIFLLGIDLFVCGDLLGVFSCRDVFWRFANGFFNVWARFRFHGVAFERVAADGLPRIAGDDDRVGMGAQSTTFFREAVPSVEDLGADSDCFGVDGVDTFDAV